MKNLYAAVKLGADYEPKVIDFGTKNEMRAVMLANVSYERVDLYKSEPMKEAVRDYFMMTYNQGSLAAKQGFIKDWTKIDELYPIEDEDKEEDEEEG